MILIYPKTDSFLQAFPVFEFPASNELRLWVVPFCLSTGKLRVPPEAPFAAFLRPMVGGGAADHNQVFAGHLWELSAVCWCSVVTNAMDATRHSVR
jgi:hypothetical protein